MEVKDINIKSEEVQEILGTPPNSLVRWGITVVFVSIGLLLGMTYIIEYPDIVEGKAVLTTENPPIKVSSFSSGHIQKLYVSDNESIEKGKPIALIESTANYEDVLETEKIVLVLDTITSIVNYEIENKRKSLGEIQNEYNNFISSFNSLQFFYKNNIEAEDNKSIDVQIKQVKSKYKKLLNQKHLLSQELKLLSRQVEKREELFYKGIVSKVEYENYRANYLQKKQQFEQFKIQISNNKIEQSNLENNISNNSFSRSYKDNETLMKFDESKDLLVSKINWWRKKYMINAPISGKISFGNVWSENQKIEQGADLFTIIPEKNQLITKIYIPQQGIGKVKEEQEILINLSSFPAAEFGFLECKVNKISLVSNADNLYIIESTMDSVLTTTFKKEISFIPQMEGTASIVTKKKRIISRIFEQFNRILNVEK